jgi:hypothetical protein
MSSTTPARPMGITILAVLSAIGGVLAILASLALIGLSGAVGVGGGMIIGLFVLVVGVLELAFAYGAWTLKPWAWTVGVAVEVLSLVSSALTVATGGSISSQLISILISAAIIYYMFTTTVNADCGRS